MPEVQAAQTAAQLPAFMPIPEWCAFSGIGRTNTYAALGRGDLKAKRAGRRTLINTAAGLRYLESLPDWTPEVGAAQ